MLEIDYRSQLAQFQTEFLSILVLICVLRIFPKSERPCCKKESDLGSWSFWLKDLRLLKSHISPLVEHWVRTRFIG